MNFPGSKINQLTAEMGLNARDTVYKVPVPTANTVLQMTCDKRVYHVSTGATYTLSLKLPPVGEAAGMFFFVKCVTGGGAAIVVDDYGDDPAFSQSTLSTTKDDNMYFSDGTYWHSFGGQDTTGDAT